jgi:hypothetical protein
VLDLDDRIAVFTTTYAKTFAVAVIARTDVDIDTATDAVARVFTTSLGSVSSRSDIPIDEEVPSGV